MLIKLDEINTNIIVFKYIFLLIDSIFLSMILVILGFQTFLILVNITTCKFYLNRGAIKLE